MFIQLRVTNNKSDAYKPKSNDADGANNVTITNIANIVLKILNPSNGNISLTLVKI